MTRRKTDAEFRKEVKALVGDEYLPLDKYKKSNIKIRFKHRKCGNVFAMIPHAFLQGHRCPKCRHKRKTDAEFKSEINSLVGTDYLVLDQYVNAFTKLRFKHQKCGQVFKTRPNDFLQGGRCPYCFYLSQKLSNEEFKQKLEQLVGDEYRPLQECLGSHQKILMLHKICNKKYYVRPHDFIRGSRCPFCQNKKSAIRKTIPFCQIKKRVEQMSNGEYMILPKEYINTHSKALFYHAKCESTFEMNPNAFFNGNRCPFCRSSNGEKVVEKYLISNHVLYESQFRINDCKDKKPLPFDFAVFNNDRSLNCLIEYQGEQHFYNPFKLDCRKMSFNVQSVQLTQKHDAMKLQYCKDHGIKLIRINHPQTSNKSKSIEFIERLVNRTLDKELKVS